VSEDKTHHPVVEKKKRKKEKREREGEIERERMEEKKGLESYVQ
jgi:hypothetical protein